jgi:hypothetical protein
MQRCDGEYKPSQNLMLYCFSSANSNECTEEIFHDDATFIMLMHGFKPCIYNLKTFPPAITSCVVSSNETFIPVCNAAVVMITAME